MKKITFFLSLMFLIFGFTNVFGAEIKFKTNSSDQSAALTTSTFKNQVSAGTEFIASVNSVNKVYAGTSGLKFGTSSAAGDFTITLADAAQLKNPTITIASAKYKSESTSFEVYLNGATSPNATITAGATSNNSFTFSGTITKIQIKSKGKRAYLSSITIEGEEGGSDLTPTSLAWSAETAIATIGADNTFPTLITTPTDLTGITYASSNTDIATIATDGTITLVASGVTTIMASFAGDDTHKAAADAKYTLTVVNPNAPEYQLFTGNLQAGEYVVYYNKVAMKAAVSSNRLGYEAVNPIEDVIQTDNATIIWKIEQNDGYWTLYNTSAGKYAAGNGTKNQAALVSSLSDAALWTVTVSNGKYEFVNKKNADASVNKNLRYNEGYGFACYGTSTGGALSLYKKADDADAISAPTISGADEFIESTEVTIAAEDGLKVYYTLDGTEPTSASTEYIAPFELTTTTTVKAVAYDGEKASDIISKTFKQLQVLTCEEAAELCAATESADKYVIRGYVTNIATAWSDQYSNISFWMADTKDGGNVFEAFRVQPIIAAEKSVKVGDYVEVIGKIVLYGTTPETSAGGTYTIIPAPVVNHTITVSANPVEGGIVTGGGEFEETDEITVKAVANEDYEFTCWTEGTDTVATTAEYTFEVLANRNLVANFVAIPAPEVKSGKFSVGENKLATFAPGNLQFNTGDSTWRFAYEQYNVVGAENINLGDPTFKGWIDMFGWSTAETYFGVNPSNSNELYDGEFVEWGKVFEGENWSTLSADEWKYLLNTRANATQLKQIATIDTVLGIMLFPDAWVMPEGIEVADKLDINYNVNVYNYTVAQWDALEDAGAIFLPAAGRRTGGYGNMINYDQQVETREDYLVNGGFYRWQDNTNIYCYYWTSTISENKNVSYLNNIVALGDDEYTIGTGAIWGEKGRYGQSVRLAQVETVEIVEPVKTIEWVLNGGDFPAVVVPTNAELWEAFKPYYNKYYTANGKLVKDRADQPIDKVSTFAAAYMQEIMTDEKSEYKWLGDYVLGVAAGQGVTLPTDMASANEGAWRWAVHAFFNATAGANGAAGTDFTEAGKPEVWGAAYQAAYGVVLPTEAVEADYTLPTPVKTGFTFVGWYDNAEGEGDAMTVLKAGWSGTIYAIWKQDATTGVDNTIVAEQVVKIVRNGQVLIMVGDKTFNMMGQEVK